MLINRCQIISAFRFQQTQFAHRSRANDLRDIARYDPPRLRLARLIANRDPFSCLDQLRDIILRGMIWHPAHRHAVAFRQRDIQQTSGFLRILEKQLVKIAEPKEQQHIRRDASAQPLVLLHHRSQRVRHPTKMKSAAANCEFRFLGGPPSTVRTALDFR